MIREDVDLACVGFHVLPPRDDGVFLLGCFATLDLVVCRLALTDQLPDPLPCLLDSIYLASMAVNLGRDSFFAGSLDASAKL